MTVQSGLSDLVRNPDCCFSHNQGPLPFFLSWFALYHQLSLDTKKPTGLFLSRCPTNQAAQPQKTARVCKFLNYKEKELYYSCSENKGTDQLRSYRICFRICSFHDAAHFHLVQRNFNGGSACLLMEYTFGFVHTD